ncbi:MAG: ATP-binding protein [Clostridia bacterium]|nr:ATP-binding protein [Clostridia bacterium]
MTSFEILWDYLKTNGQTQESFSAQLGIDRRTLGRWIKNGFSHSTMSPEYLCKSTFGSYDHKLAKGFINYLKGHGYTPETNIINKNGSIDADGFEAFFSSFLSGDKKEVQKSRNFLLPVYYFERSGDIEEICQTFEGGCPAVHAIIGERGIGKSTLAKSFANYAVKEKIFKHIIFVSFSNSIEDTVIKINSEDGGDSTFAGKIRMLKNLQKSGNTLLIIDNFDDPNLNDTLSEDNSAYINLLDTECSLLFTSTSDLSHCYCVDDRVTHLSPLPTDELLRIFFKIRGESDDNEVDVRKLIDNYLLGNTYLTVLCAELSKQGMNAVKIIDTIKDLRANDTDYFSAQKDGKRQDEKNLLEHYCCVLDNNKVINPDDADMKREMHSILSVLALLPIGGISSVDFDNFAYPYAKRKIFKKTIARLKKHNLIFENDGRIYLQPIVKEYLMREVLILGEDTHYYLDTLTKKLRVESYDDEMMRWVAISEAAYSALNDEHTQSNARSRTLELSETYQNEDKVDESINTAILLGIRITACYSSVNMFAKAYEFGCLALEGLKYISQSQKQTFDMLTVATCYNIVGFAFLHGEEQSFAKNMKTAFDCIKKGIDYAQKAQSMEYTTRALIVISKLWGTFAAYYLMKKEYGTALEYHSRALHEREQLIGEDPECEEYKIMLAFTYRGIGTDYFYLSREADKEKNLHLSYINNLKSVELFEELYGSNRLETVEGYNRLIGTALGLINAVSEDKLAELIGCHEDEVIEGIYSCLNSAFEFYASCGVSLNGEMADSLKKLITLTERKIARGQFTKADADFNLQVVQTVKSISTANNTCLDLLVQLERIM